MNTHKNNSFGILTRLKIVELGRLTGTGNFCDDMEEDKNVVLAPQLVRNGPLDRILARRVFADPNDYPFPRVLVTVSWGHAYSKLPITSS